MSIPHGVVAVDSDHIVAVWNPIVIAIWRHQTTSPSVRQMRDIIVDAARHAARGLSLVQVVEGSASMPDASGRHALGDMLSDSRDIVRFSSVVYEGDGFKAAAVRCIVSSLALIAKPPFPHRIFASLEASAAWQVAEMRSHMKSNITPVEYCDTINALRPQILEAKRSA